MIREALIRGIYDPEIKLSLLSEKDASTPLEDVIKFIEAREGGKQSAQRTVVGNGLLDGQWQFRNFGCI